ncbi:hypothetical protein [Ulvibacterium sp.]|uniref:hypothetical protein n=1 Tax=Ulvibacterium sp. TaxID=2665914 RepID=UPI002602DBE1|nr:hypothetical protein [Ulvibacterium sp.]
MKYRPTILNIASLGLMVWSHYTYWTSKSTDVEGWGMLALIVLTGAGILGLVIDAIIQRFSNNWLLTNVIGILILAGHYIFNLWHSREKIIILPDNYKGHITIVYGVENTEPLFKSNLNFGYEVKIPTSGILFTSTKENNDVSRTKVIMRNGVKLNTSSDPKALHALLSGRGNFDCNGKNWEYRSWHISNKNWWSSNSDSDTTSVKKIKNYCAGIK